MSDQRGRVATALTRAERRYKIFSLNYKEPIDRIGYLADAAIAAMEEPQEQEQEQELSPLDALAKACFVDGLGFQTIGWEDNDESLKDTWRSVARAALRHIADGAENRLYNNGYNVLSYGAQTDAVDAVLGVPRSEYADGAS